MYYDLTKVGPVCTEVPVMVMVRDSPSTKWTGPYPLLCNAGIDFQAYSVWNEACRTVGFWNMAKLYQGLQKTTRPMNIEEVVQLVKDGAAFRIKRSNEIFYNPIVTIEDNAISIYDSVNWSSLDELEFLYGGEWQKMEVEVIDE